MRMRAILFVLLFPTLCLAQYGDVLPLNNIRDWAYFPSSVRRYDDGTDIVLFYGSLKNLNAATNVNVTMNCSRRTIIAATHESRNMLITLPQNIAQAALDKACKRPWEFWK